MGVKAFAISFHKLVLRSNSILEPLVLFPLNVIHQVAEKTQFSIHSVALRKIVSSMMPKPSSGKSDPACCRPTLPSIVKFPVMPCCHYCDREAVFHCLFIFCFLCSKVYEVKKEGNQHGRRTCCIVVPTLLLLIEFSSYRLYSSMSFALGMAVDKMKRLAL